jgi:hypothetical protein
MKELDQYSQIKKDLEDFKVDLTVRIEIVERKQAAFPSNLIERVEILENKLNDSKETKVS